MKDTLRKIMVILIGLILNFLGRFLARSFNLPLWLDMTGTCIASYFGGIWSGIIAGLTNDLIFGLFDMSSLVYSMTSLTAALVIHIFIKRGYMNSASKALVSSFWLGILCTLVSTPLNFIFNNGYSGNIWGDALVDMLKWYDVSNVLAATAGEAIIEIADRQICVMLAYVAICVVRRLKKRKRTRGNMLALILTAGIVIGSVDQSIYTQAKETDLLENNFVGTIYDHTNGMVSSEANVICESDDGYIWIGSYAGLTKYDGNDFEFVHEEGISNVVGMMTDSQGRVWIGTNDAGIVRYDDGKYISFTEQDGLPSNSIRCFTEDKYGNVYVGTSDKICRFSTDDKIEVVKQNITFVKSMVTYADMLIAMDNNGYVYAIDGENVLTIRDEHAKELFYSCLAVTSHGLLAGTESGELIVFEISEQGIREKKRIDISANEITAVFEDSENRIWIAAESGFGYLAQDNNYQKMHYDNFDSAIVGFHEDYQGNIWIASSHYGVMKLSESRFMNIFDKAGIDNTVVNAVTYYNGDYYCGTEEGLIIIGGKKLRRKHNDLTRMTDGSRIRSIYADSENRLWVCTYSGLICYNSDNEIYCYQSETDRTTSDRFRCITELKDGTLAAGTADGINFIKNGKLTGTVTDEDGIDNTQILSIVEGLDGNVWAGSDGSGIYVISEGKMIENYTVEDGLSSDIVLRIVPHEDGYLIVTSNSLCHIDFKGKIRRLTNFPYFNNYDVIIENDTAYITGSAGIYKSKLSELCADKAEKYKLYSANEGLFSALTANSWNYLSPEGTVYLCSNNGVIFFDNSSREEEINLKYGIVSVECDGKKFDISDDNTSTVPAFSRDISINASVRNYAFTDARVRFYVKELDLNPVAYRLDEIEPIQISKPELSEYHLCFQILDSTDDTVLEEMEFTIHRETQMWEEPYYKTYLLIVCSEIFLFAIISVVTMILIAMRKNELERLHVVLEKKVNKQTEELRIQQVRTKELFMQTVTALSEAVDAKDRYTSGHSKRVAEYAQMIAARMGKSKEEQEEIYRAGLLHDVGKIRIPREIINKTSRLTDEEFNIIKIHPATGYNILRGISGSSLIAMGAKYHHERYDGNGYPNGISGEKIPEVARILGVADSYDAMTSDRSYRAALSQEVVRSEIEKGKGTQFDPDIADIMLQLIDEDKNYTMKQGSDLNRTILVVDDEAMSIKLVKHIMQDEPMYEITAASGGREALDILKHQSFDLILLDMKMPEMDGLETLRRIRERYQTPVALMTGERNLDTVTAFAELGCDDFITKPFQPLLIKEVIHNMTGRKISTTSIS